MIKKVKTNEGIQYKKLSPEEMKARGILGRLIGPCADFNKATRNGRKYSEQLWENVFNDPIMQEKIRNGVCFGELGHPEDRTEIDMEKIAVCLREQPVKNDKGQLCAVFDILDTPNGRILKTLCDYGSTVGVSSRGQGDLITDMNGDEAVDPDTYECECWDVVLVPAVESARMQYVKEDLDRNTLRMKKALTESLNNATEEDKKVMEKTLEELNIKLDNTEVVTEEVKEPEETAIVEEVENKEVTEEVASTEATKIVEEAEEEKPAEEEVKVEETEEVAEEIPEVKFTADEVKEVATEVVSEVAGPIEDKTEEEAKKEIEKAVEVKVDAAVEEKVEEMKSEEAVEEAPAEEVPTEVQVEKEPEDEAEINLEIPAEEEKVEECINESCADIKEEAKEVVEESANAIDDGDAALIKSLQEALKGKSDLEGSVKSLQEKLAVSDTKVNELTEENNNYKKAIARLATMSKSNKDLKESVTKLEESLKEKDAVIEEQKSRIARLVKSRKESVSESASLTESIETKKSEITTLTEDLNKSKDEVKALTEKLSDSDNKVSELNEGLTKATALKEAYKKLANKAVNKYIEIKATTLGLTSTDIKRKLGESYTLDDVDQVCEDLKAYQLNVSKLPFSVDRKVGVRVNESANIINNKSAKLFDDDEVDEQLIKIARI